MDLQEGSSIMKRLVILRGLNGAVDLAWHFGRDDVLENPPAEFTNGDPSRKLIHKVAHFWLPEHAQDVREELLLPVVRMVTK
jgi:hypothetical protein